jgi:hypothetical protein
MFLITGQVKPILSDSVHKDHQPCPTLPASQEVHIQSLGLLTKSIVSRFEVHIDFTVFARQER